MARREVPHPALEREMLGRLGHFAADVDVGAGRDGRLEKALRPAGAPRHTAHFAVRRSEHQRYAPQFRLDVGGQCRKRGRLRRRAKPSELIRAETAAIVGETEQLAELGVIAELRVRVEGQMKGKQIDVVADQHPETPALHPGNAGIFVLPEIAVMDENGIRPPIPGRLEERQAGGHAAGDSANIAAPLDL